MAGRLTVSTLNDDTGVLATQNGMRGVAKAWVNFNGTGTVAIRGSFNVSSITDNGTGDYTINFTTAMPDVNYSLVGTLSQTRGDGSSVGILCGSDGAAPTLMSTSQVRVAQCRSGGATIDSNVFCVSVFSS